MFLFFSCLSISLSASFLSKMSITFLTASPYLHPFIICTLLHLATFWVAGVFFSPNRHQPSWHQKPSEAFFYLVGTGVQPSWHQSHSRCCVYLKKASLSVLISLKKTQDISPLRCCSIPLSAFRLLLPMLHDNNFIGSISTLAFPSSVPTIIFFVPIKGILKNIKFPLINFTKQLFSVSGLFVYSNCQLPSCYQNLSTHFPLSFGTIIS